MHICLSFGRSLFFAIPIYGGSMLGILSKLLAWRVGAELNPLLRLHGRNLAVPWTGFGLAVYFSGIEVAAL